MNAYIKTITICLKIWLTKWWIVWICTCYSFGYMNVCVCVCVMCKHVVSIFLSLSKCHAMHPIENLVWNSIQMKGIVTQIVLFMSKNVAYILLPISSSNRISNYDLCWGLIFNQNQISKKPSLWIQVSWLLCVYIYK